MTSDTMNQEGQPQYTPAEQEIFRLQNMVETMSATLQEMQSQHQPTFMPSEPPPTILRTSEPKVNQPDTFTGTRSKVNSFISQLDIYFTLRPSQFSSDIEKIFFAASYLRDSAFHWFEPQLRLLTAHASGSLDSLPETVVKTYSDFRTTLRATFGDIDEIATAERQLKSLRQTTSASFYTTEFQRIVSHLQWDKEALMFFYYNGLKDNLKDELARDEKPSNLNELIEKSIKIDNRLFERKRERDFGKPSQYTASSRPRFVPEPMDLDASMSSKPSTFNRPNNPPPRTGKSPLRPLRPSKSSGKLSSEERNYRFENNLCLYCGQAGHQVKQCNLARQKASVFASVPSELLQIEDSYDYDYEPSKNGETQQN